MPDGDNMELVDQESVYKQCGLKIKSDLLGIWKDYGIEMALLTS